MLVHLISVVSALPNSTLPYPRSEVQTGQAGPIFVVSEASIAARADQVTLQTLAGVIARHSPRVYTIKSATTELTPATVNDDTTVFWLHDLATHHGITFNETFLHDLAGLIRHFAHTLTGFVKYDPSTASTNAALIRCAAEDGLVVAGTPEMVANLTRLGLRQVADVSASNPLDEFERSKAKLSRRGLVAQPDDGSKSNCLSSYSTFARLATVEHGSGDGRAFAAVLDHLDSTKLSAAFGWTSYDEHEFTAAVTRAGGVVHASDFAYNLDVLSQLPPYTLPPALAAERRERQALERREREREREGGQGHGRAVHTVAFVNSDGDNLQLLQNDWLSTSHWNHPQRGRQPAGWTYSPAMAELMPSLLAYAVRTMGANDSLSTGPSGVGYAYPQLFAPAQRELFARATNELMARSGMTLANVIGVVPSEQSVAPLAAAAEVAAMVYFTFGVADQGYAGLHGNVAYVGDAGKPVVGLRYNLWGDAPSGDKVGVAGLVRQLKQLPKDPSDPRSYSVVVNELGNNFSEVVDAAALLVADGGFDVVLPEVLVQRLEAHTARRQQCPMPNGKWAAEAGDLPKCWLPSDGSSCVLTCNRLLDPLPLHVACDLNVCSNLTLADSKLHFICAETGTVCPSSARRVA